jgi:hypothetical protein
VNSHFFTKSFFYRYGRQTTPKIASHGLFHKKSFIFSIRGFKEVTWIVVERSFVKKAHERLFLALFAVHTGKKRFREKV